MIRDANENVEYLHCYLQMIDFKELKDVKEMERFGRSLHSRIAELTLRAETKVRIAIRMEHGEWKNDLFDEARVDVFEMMKSTTFKNFLCSEEYKWKRDGLWKAYGSF